MGRRKRKDIFADRFIILNQWTLHWSVIPSLSLSPSIIHFFCLHTLIIRDSVTQNKILLYSQILLMTCVWRPLIQNLNKKPLPLSCLFLMWFPWFCTILCFHSADPLCNSVNKSNNRRHLKRAPESDQQHQRKGIIRDGKHSARSHEPWWI